MALESISMTTLQSTANWSAANDLVGKIAAAMQNVPEATLISDNNPSSTTARVIIYKIGTSNHYLKIYSRSQNLSIGCYVLKLDGINPCYSDGSYFYQYQNPLNQVTYILHSQNMFLLYMNGTMKMSSNNGYMAVPMYLKLSDGTWVAHTECPSYSDNYVYFNVNDTSGGDLGVSRVGTYLGYYDYQGNYFPIKGKYKIGSQIQAFEPLAWFQVGGAGLFDETLYQDASGNYWFYYYNRVVTDKIV